jgi:hypothetical protein
MEARRTRRFAFTPAILVIVLVATAAALSPGASARRGLSVARAEVAARDAVLAHSSYRQIRATRSALATRRCWRVAAGVRCSLYVVAPNPCALSKDPAGVCVQALWERRWLVEVAPGRHGPAARILRISSGPSTTSA